MTTVTVEIGDTTQDVGTPTLALIDTPADVTTETTDPTAVMTDVVVAVVVTTGMSSVSILRLLLLHIALPSEGQDDQC